MVRRTGKRFRDKHEVPAPSWLQLRCFFATFPSWLFNCVCWKPTPNGILHGHFRNVGPILQELTNGPQGTNSGVAGNQSAYASSIDMAGQKLDPRVHISTVSMPGLGPPVLAPTAHVRGHCRIRASPVIGSDQRLQGPHKLLQVSACDSGHAALLRKPQKGTREGPLGPLRSGRLQCSLARHFPLGAACEVGI